MPPSRILRAIKFLCSLQTTWKKSLMQKTAKQWAVSIPLMLDPCRGQSRLFYRRIVHGRIQQQETLYIYINNRQYSWNINLVYFIKMFTQSNVLFRLDAYMFANEKGVFLRWYLSQLFFRSVIPHICNDKFDFNKKCCFLLFSIKYWVTYVVKKITRCCLKSDFKKRIEGIT